jgi:hypothetical protein
LRASSSALSVSFSRIMACAVDDVRTAGAMRERENDPTLTEKGVEGGVMSEPQRAQFGWRGANLKTGHGASSEQEGLPS